MVRVLLDTCMISELQRTEMNPRVRTTYEEFDPHSLFLSVVTFGELTNGIELLPPSRRKRGLASWLLRIEQSFSDRILTIDIETARLWGEITAREQIRGVQIPATDGLIAATALRHGMHVMTRNSKHFAATGASIIDPWQE